MISNNAPLSEQIREAQHEWAVAQRDYDILKGMQTVLRDRKINNLMEQKVSEAKAKREVEGSEWYESYVRNTVEAKYAALNARGKWEFLKNLSEEERDARFQERMMAKI